MKQNKNKKTIRPAKGHVGLVPLPLSGVGILTFLETGALGVAKLLSPAQASLLLAQLHFALWLVIAKARLKHRSIGKFIKRLTELCPYLPTRSELDLWVRMLLQVLHKYGHLPTAELKHYRRDASPLHRITHAQLEKIAADYRTLRELQKEFSMPKPKSDEQVILELLIAVHRRIEATPDAFSDEAKAEFQAIQLALRATNNFSRNSSGSKRGKQPTPGNTVVKSNTRKKN